MRLPDFTKASILVVGDIMLDRYWFGDTARVSPEAPVPIVNIKQIDERPGGAANVALNIAALGGRITLLGLAGQDDAATQLESQLTAAGVQHDIVKIPGTTTITKLRIISRHQQLIRLDFEETFSPFDPAMLIERFQRHLAHTNLVILSDYAKGTLSSAHALIELAKKANIPVFVDPKGTDFYRYNGASVITPNLKEFEAIVGHCHTEKELVQKAQAFLQTSATEALLLTRGERGMTLIEKNKEEEHLPSHARDVFDVTGAGDTVIAVLGVAVAAGASLSHAMTLANFAASLVVSKLGAASVSAPELQAGFTHAADDTLSGVLDEERLAHAIANAKRAGKRVVFTNGCFDILHAGHVTYLQQAKQLGDYLIVAINDDASVKRLKGSKRPINTVEQRMAVLVSIGVVDWVTSFSDDTPERLLRKLQPDTLIKGGDYTPDQVVGADIVLSYGGDVRVLGLVKNISTTSIIDRCTKE